MGYVPGLRVLGRSSRGVREETGSGVCVCVRAAQFKVNNVVVIAI